MTYLATVDSFCKVWANVTLHFFLTEDIVMFLSDATCAPNFASFCTSFRKFFVTWFTQSFLNTTLTDTGEIVLWDCPQFRYFSEVRYAFSSSSFRLHPEFWEGSTFLHWIHSSQAWHVLCWYIVYRACNFIILSSRIVVYFKSRILHF